MTAGYKHLTHSDRSLLGILWKYGSGVREISRKMGFSPSTISRELRRNRHQINDYNCNLAQGWTKARRRSANREKAKLQPMHFSFIHEQLKLTLSPEQIASLFPKKFGFKTTARAIYRYFEAYRYSPYWSELATLLRKKSKIKRANWRFDRKKMPFDPPRISKRSEFINNRRIYGHWEMDLMEGPRKGGPALLVLVERKSRYSIAKLVPDGKADNICRIAKNALRGFKVFSVTTDNGSEFRKYDDLRKALDTEIFYCYPYRSWEKGAVENNIGLYRDFFPKRTRLPKTYHDVKRAQTLINNRPKKVCGFKTPQSFLAKITT